MRSLTLFVIYFASMNVFAGVSLGNTGSSKTQVNNGFGNVTVDSNRIYSAKVNQDLLVKYLRKDRSEIEFQVKAQQGNLTIEKMRPEEFTGENSRVLDALRKSAAEKEWVRIQMQYNR